MQECPRITLPDNACALSRPEWEELSFASFLCVDSEVFDEQLLLWVRENLYTRAIKFLN
jgi:hypothetical protein